VTATHVRPHRPRRLLLAAPLLVVAVAAATILAPSGILATLTPGALSLLPAALLAAFLLAGRYPGEKLIARVAVSRAPCRRPRRFARLLVPSAPASALVRGGRLIAASLAGRAPPAPAAG
jgi:hypothetical protein